MKACSKPHARRRASDAPCAARAACGGFTLVDLLLATVITGVLLGAVYGVFRAGLAASSRGTDEARLNFSGMYVLDVMARDLRCALFLPRPRPQAGAPQQAGEPGQDEDDAGIPPLFEGAADEIAFWTTSARPGAVPYPAHRLRYRYQPDDAAAAGSLILESTPAAGRVELADEPVAQILVDGVAAFALRYLKEGAWQDEWDDAEALPGAVEIMIEIMSGDGRLRRAFTTVVDLPAWKAAEQS